VALLYLSLANNATRAQRNADESALLRLPPEIRQRIWNYAVHAQTVTIGDVYPNDSQDYPEQSILRVCRQVHAETCLLPYSHNSFWPDDMDSLAVWLTRRLPEQMAAIQRIEIDCRESSAATLRLLPGIKYVGVYCICDGLCPDVPARGKAIQEALGDIWRNYNLNIKIM